MSGVLAGSGCAVKKMVVNNYTSDAAESLLSLTSCLWSMTLTRKQDLPRVLADGIWIVFLLPQLLVILFSSR